MYTIHVTCQKSISSIVVTWQWQLIFKTRWQGIIHITPITIMSTVNFWVSNSNNSRMVLPLVLLRQQTMLGMLRHHRLLRWGEEDMSLIKINITTIRVRGRGSNRLQGILQTMAWFINSSSSSSSSHPQITIPMGQQQHQQHLPTIIRMIQPPTMPHLVAMLLLVCLNNNNTITNNNSQLVQFQILDIPWHIINNNSSSSIRIILVHHHPHHTLHGE